mmetsp:Transcript_24555/g.48884  ORF Transcript_24555/g.48884 Transcript_24555/m.48884 type:complete len:471 (+) Transcript_24555:264-1676(+)
MPPCAGTVTGTTATTATRNENAPRCPSVRFYPRRSRHRLSTSLLAPFFLLALLALHASATDVSPPRETFYLRFSLNLGPTVTSGCVNAGAAGCTGVTDSVVEAVASVLEESENLSVYGSVLVFDMTTGTGVPYLAFSLVVDVAAGADPDTDRIAAEAAGAVDGAADDGSLLDRFVAAMAAFDGENGGDGYHERFRRGRASAGTGGDGFVALDLAATDAPASRSTEAPTSPPTFSTDKPTDRPTVSTDAPTSAPTASPTLSSAPASRSTEAPTSPPTFSTDKPTDRPTVSTDAPTSAPTASPTLSSAAPTASPTLSSAAPTAPPADEGGDAADDPPPPPSLPVRAPMEGGVEGSGRQLARNLAIVAAVGLVLYFAGFFLNGARRIVTATRKPGDSDAKSGRKKSPGPSTSPPDVESGPREIAAPKFPDNHPFVDGLPPLGEAPPAMSVRLSDLSNMSPIDEASPACEFSAH